MSHHIYTTPGFIVHSLPSGEAGKYFLLFTRDLGMIGATASGVRLSKSKLRYYLQDYACSLFSVVKGKEVWRITGAVEAEGSVEVPTKNKKLYVRILSLLKRLLPGEEKHSDLFELIESFYVFLSENTLTKEDSELVEYVTVLRMLDRLGYISGKGDFKSLLSDFSLHEQVLSEAMLMEDLMVEAINNGLKESHL